MTKVAIFGVGLIGGSLALCLKGKPGYRIVGHSPRPASVRKYLDRGVVDEATVSFEKAAEDADFIFLCVPVGEITPCLERLHRLKLKPGCIVTDVGSTKLSVVRHARQLQWPQDVHFIGGHPMAGSERSGVEAASSHLFENAYYVLTPTEETPEHAYERLAEVLKHTKAQIIRMDALEHDEIVGAVSHLPHIIAAALVKQISDYDQTNNRYSMLAAGGFHDITRIASSDPVIWRDILLNNRSIILRLLDDWNEQISVFTDMLLTGDGEGIMELFRKSGEFRARLPERRKGVISPIHDIYVDVPDHPGVIGQIASLLGASKINLQNIQIMESRLDVPGVLRLSFRDQEDKDRAVALLKRHQYAVHP